MKAQIRRLRLQEGDIVVVKDRQTCDALSAAGRTMNLKIRNVPIVIAPDGIRRVSREYLLKILGIKEGQ